MLDRNNENFIKNLNKKMIKLENILKIKTFTFETQKLLKTVLNLKQV